MVNIKLFDILKFFLIKILILGEERSRQVTSVLTENHEMLESFSIINIELTTLARNLKTAENDRERQKQVNNNCNKF